MVALSVVIPAKNEQENIGVLVQEVQTMLRINDISGEIIVVNDASTDQTLQTLQRIKTQVSQLRVITHQYSSGQSAAIRTGVLAAKGSIIATLDGDGQNDPKFIPQLLQKLQQDSQVALVAGQRVDRQDDAVKNTTSRWANAIRAWALKDGIRDTGCGLKVFYREVFLLLPYFDHIHRYLPALVLREGRKVATADVSHRARTAGHTKYGTLDRLLVGLIDLPGVMWLCRRRRLPGQISEQ